MGNLTNEYINQTYPSLVKFANSYNGVSGSLQNLQDGLGDNLPIQISTDTVNISGSFLVNGQPITANIDSSSLVTTASFNAYTSSNDTRVNSLISQTGSYVTETESGSFMITGSVSGNVLTFTKGNGSTFNLSVDTGSFVSASYATNAATASIAYDLIVYGKNNNAGTLTKGTIVRIVGADGNNPLFDTASWTDDANSANTLGMLTADVAHNAFTNIVTQGTVIGINTAGMTAGQMLYLSSSGQYTTSSVPAPYHEVRLGQVLRSNLNNGSAYISVDNGYELSELHDVDITSPVNGDLLVYRSGSYGQWVNETGAEIGFATTSSLNTKLDTGSFNSYTSSNDSKVNSLIAATGSYVTEAESGSFMVTGSVSENVLTFTKGDGSQFNLTVATGSGGGSINTGSFATTGSNQFSGSQEITGALKVVLYDQPYDSYFTFAEFNANNNPAIQFNTDTKVEGGNLTVTGDIKGNFITDKDGTNPLVVSGSQGINLIGEVDVTGSVNILGDITANSASFTYLETIYQTSSVLFSSGSNILGDEAGDTQTLYGTVNIPTGPLIVNGVNGNLTVTGNTQVGNLLRVGNGANITGSVNISGTVTSGLGFNGDLSGTASFATNALSASFATNALSASYAPPSPVVGVITTGSIGTSQSMTGSLSISSSASAANGALVLGNDTGIQFKTAGGTKSTLYYSGSAGGSRKFVMDSSDSATSQIAIIAGDTGGVNIGGGVTGTGHIASTPVQITGSLTVSGSSHVINGPLTHTGSINQQGNIFLRPQFLSGITFNHVTQSNEVSSSNIIGIMLNQPTQTGSIILSGSNNIILNALRATTPAGSLGLINGSGNILTSTVFPTLSSGSLGTFTFDRNIGIGVPIVFAPYSSSAVSTITNNIGANGFNVNNYSGSTNIAGNGLQGTLNINNYVSSSTIATSVTLQQNIIAGTHTVTMSGTTFGANAQKTLLGNLIAGNTNTIYGNTTNNTGSLQSTLIVGNTLIVSASSGNSAGTPGALFGGAFIGRYNDDSGTLANSHETVFAIGTGTGTGAKRTSLLVSGSGLTVVRNGLDVTGSLNAASITGSLLGTSSYATNALTASYALNSGGGSIDTGSFATTGSNNFTGNQNIASGSYLQTDGITNAGPSENIEIAPQSGANVIVNFTNSTDKFIVKSKDVLGGSLSLVEITGSLNVTNGITGSLEGTASYAVTASYALNSVDTGSLVNNVSLSLLGNDVVEVTKGDGSSTSFTVNNVDSASFADNATSASYATNALTASYALNSPVVSPFPFTGSAVITGSLTITGSASGNVNALSITSNTASLNLNDGNFFTLQLPIGAVNTFINPSNIKAGQTINILLSTSGSNNTVTFPSSVKQASGSAYVPTTTTGKDIITLVSFDSSTLYLANVKNLI